jgi:hypothetical protein
MLTITPADMNENENTAAIHSRANPGSLCMPLMGIEAASPFHSTNKQIHHWKLDSSSEM